MPDWRVVLARLRQHGPQTAAEMIRWTGKSEPDAKLCLGILARCGMIKRVGTENGVSIWGLGHQ